MPLSPRCLHPRVNRWWVTDERATGVGCRTRGIQTSGQRMTGLRTWGNGRQGDGCPGNERPVPDSRAFAAPVQPPKQRGKLSIGMFTYSTRPRGSVVCAAQLADALTARGHDVRLYALDKGEGGFYTKLNCDLQLVPTAPAPEDPDALIEQRIAEVAAHLESHGHRHDLLHAQDCLVASGILRARHATRKGGESTPLVRTLHHVDRFDSPYLQRCQRRSVVQADAVVSVSRATRDDASREFGVRSVLIHNGANRAEQPESDDSDVSSASTLACEHAVRTPYVLSVGGIEPRKNSLKQLEAFARVLKQQPQLQWVIAGGASIWKHAAYRDGFEQAVARLPAGAVRVLGVLPQRHLASLYRHATVFLHAAKHEGWGLSVLEAMAFGCPVIASRGAPFDEYLDEGCAALVDPADSDDIAVGVLRALSEGKGLAECGMRRAARFSWERCAEQHEALYQRLLHPEFIGPEAAQGLFVGG